MTTTIEIPSLPDRSDSAHKGHFGMVCVIGGQAAHPINGGTMMLGSPVLAALGALRIGAGRVAIATPAPLAIHALTMLPEATCLALPVDERDNAILPSAAAAVLDKDWLNFACAVIGPGMGHELHQQQMVVRLIAQDDVPLVIDADALTALAKLHDFRGDFRASAILTPHPGEYQRLAKAIGISRDALDPQQRESAAMELAQRLGCVVVLKGDGVVVTDGHASWIAPSGSAALATGGTGDVLAGFIAGAVSQWHHPRPAETSSSSMSLLECAVLAVSLGIDAAAAWAKKHGNAGLLAHELADAMPNVLNARRQ
ncbi:MAG: NAD(P)H-hydrate dehydratase [Phycisphaerales bacterium]